MSPLFVQIELMNANLVPRFSYFPAPWSKRGETRAWFGLVTCLPDFSRLQVSSLREGQIVGNLSPLSPLASVACRQSKQTSREALWTELYQMGVFSRCPKGSVNLPLLQISVVAGFVNQLEMYLARRTFMQKEIAHCSSLLRTSMGGH